MADASTQAAATTVTISDDTRAQFPDVIELIMGSQSMNDEERQYWINILPIMTPDQMKNLRDILTNEKEQLAAIDTKYVQQVQHSGNSEEFLRQVEEERKRRQAERQQKEEQRRQEEEKAAVDLLQQINQA